MQQAVLISAIASLINSADRRRSLVAAQFLTPGTVPLACPSEGQARGSHGEHRSRLSERPGQRPAR